ncbi:hypothetical protein BHM03_00015760 [Ensete ventricosum]|nr:hypothetical protein BHM03_00015760 [Ensete ventricosum]
MGFFVGLFLGVVIGVGLVMAFAHSENARSKRRAELAATVAALSKMTVEDSRKLLPAEFYPSWVVFSQRQKFGVFRLIFKPLVDEFPCFGAVSYSLREKNFVIVQGTIRDAIEDSITWPVRKVIPILPGDYRHHSTLNYIFALLHQVHVELLFCPFGTENDFSNPFAVQKFSMTSLEKALKGSTNGTDTANLDRTATQRKKEVIVRGVLSVTVISAEDLPAMDLMGKADPFVVVRMKKAETKNKTRVIS